MRLSRHALALAARPDRGRTASPFDEGARARHWSGLSGRWGWSLSDESESHEQPYFMTILWRNYDGRQPALCSYRDLNASGFQCGYIGKVAIAAWLARGSAVLVANPTAHSGSAAEWIRHARELLDRAGIPHRFEPTRPDGGTVELVRDLV